MLKIVASDINISGRLQSIVAMDDNTLFLKLKLNDHNVGPDLCVECTFPSVSPEFVELVRRTSRSFLEDATIDFNNRRIDKNRPVSSKPVITKPTGKTAPTGRTVKLL